MGACATKPGDLKVKGEAPLVVEDAAPPLVACEEKVKADVVVPAAAAAEADPADAGRRRSLSDLLKQDADTSDGEAEKAVTTVEPATSAGVEAGSTLGAPVQDVVATEQDGTADQPREDPSGDVQAVVEEEKRVDPDSVQVAVAAAPSADESEVADEASA